MDCGVRYVALHVVPVTEKLDRAADQASNRFQDSEHIPAKVCQNPRPVEPKVLPRMRGSPIFLGYRSPTMFRKWVCPVFFTLPKLRNPSEETEGSESGLIPL